MPSQHSLRAGLAIASLCLLGALAAGAQTTELEPGKIVLKQPNGAISFQLLGDSDLGAFNVLLLGRADPGGAASSDVDLRLVDPNSELSATDPAVSFNASGASLVLGSGNAGAPGADGDLLIQDGMGATTLILDGASRNATQTIDPADPTAGNGFVKAWAKIAADGTVVSCWNCNESIFATYRLDTGEYRVQFTVGDISSRPVSAVISAHSSGTVMPSSDAWIQPADGVGGENAVVVAITAFFQPLPPFPGAPLPPLEIERSDEPFTVFVF